MKTCGRVRIRHSSHLQDSLNFKGSAAPYLMPLFFRVGNATLFVGIVNRTPLKHSTNGGCADVAVRNKSKCRDSPCVPGESNKIGPTTLLGNFRGGSLQAVHISHGESSLGFAKYSSCVTMQPGSGGSSGRGSPLTTLSGGPDHRRARHCTFDDTMTSTGGKGLFRSGSPPR